MKPRIIFGGESQLRRSPEFRARLEALRESIRGRYQPRLVAAGFLRRLALRMGMELEFRRERRKIGPSRHSLYLGLRREGPI